MLDKEELEININFKSAKPDMTIRYCLQKGEIRCNIRREHVLLLDSNTSYPPMFEIKESSAGGTICAEEYFNIAKFNENDQIASSNKLSVIIEGQGKLNTFTISFYEKSVAEFEQGMKTRCLTFCALWILFRNAFHHMAICSSYQIAYQNGKISNSIRVKRNMPVK